MNTRVRSSIAAIAALIIFSMARSSAAIKPMSPIHDHSSQLMRLAGLKALPKHKVVGHGLHLGVITDAKTWDKVRAAGKLAPLKVSSWKRQMIVYVVLGAQTNRLTFASFMRRGGRGVFSFHWSGIKPFYKDATPAVFAVVDRRSLREVEFQQTVSGGGARPLGVITLP